MNGIIPIQFQGAIHKVTLLRVIAAVSVALASLATPVLAGENGKGDVYGQVGFYHETDLTKAMVGGGASAILGDSGNVAIFGEANYIPVGNMGIFGASFKGVMLGGGVRLYVPTKNERVRVYVPVAGGLMRLSGSAFGFSESMNAGYFGAGIGTELGSRKVGVRPEFRYLRVQKSDVGGNSVTFGVGVFYRF
jgi:hypothetical protein